MEENNQLFEHLNDKDFNIEELYRGKGPILLALFSDSSSDILSHEAVLFPGKILNMTKPNPPVNIQRTSSTLIGRHRIMFEVIEKLLKTRIVHIVGQKGIGKSSLIKQVGYFLHTRNNFHEGIF